MILPQVCLNQNNCALELGNFNMGLCPGAVKRLAVEAVCS